MTRQRTKFVVGSLCALVLSATAATAHGAPPALDASEARADALFREGTEKLDAGKVDEACVALAESLRLDSKLGTLLNLALCHEKQGKTATAWTEFSHAAAWAADAGQTDRRDFAHLHAVALERSLVRVQIHLSTSDPVVIAIDGEAVAPSRGALPLFVDPGRHALTVTARSKKPFVTEIVAALPAGAPHGNAAQIVNVPDLVDEAAPAYALASKETPLVPSRAPRAGRWVGLGLGAVSIVGLGVGIGFAASSLAMTGDAGAHCSAAGCDAEGLSAIGDAKTAEAVSLVAFSVSAVALGTGAWLWLSARPRDGSLAGLRIVPVAEPHGGAMNARWTW
jgi:hypothetical protein